MSDPIKTAVECSVAEMKTSAGSDFYVMLRMEGREITPHMFKIKGRAEYEVAEWQWFFGQRDEKPSFADFDCDEPIPQSPPLAERLKRAATLLRRLASQSAEPDYHERHQLLEMAEAKGREDERGRITPETVRFAERLSADTERARIVAWLRRYRDTSITSPGTAQLIASALAEAIDRLDHQQGAQSKGEENGS